LAPNSVEPAEPGADGDGRGGGGLLDGTSPEAAGIVTTVLQLGQRACLPEVPSGVRIEVWQLGHLN
jgi:hypothetical protein